MDINELESFKMSDAVKFHKELNPQLWEDEKLDPEVRDQLLLIAEDFVEYLGISNLKVKDVTISGSNAAYSYTPHSDLDLHVLVDFNELPDNEVYQELFTAKKTLYNDAHDISVHGVPVELYVQDTNQPVQSLGEYSIVHDKWIRIPKKRRANYDEAATKAKYEKLGDLIELALKSKDSKRVSDAIALVKRYRKSGLDKHGEFGPENLAYKAVRKQGLVQALYDLKAQLHGEKLSIEEAASRDDALIKIKKLLQTAGRTPAEKENIKRIVAKMMQQWNIDPNEINVREPVDPLKAKIAKAAYEKQMAYDAMKDAWSKFKKGIFAEEETDEDFDPNGPPPGPEFKPTMPAGTVRVDVSDVYDWYKLGKNISNLDQVDPSIFGKGPPSTIMAFGTEPEEHKYIKSLKKLGLNTTDIDPKDPKQPKGLPRQSVDTTYNVNEASGYIPSEKEKNDPRFKTALTVDVKPDAIKKNAKAFNWKTSRAGIPPQARPDGKIAEDLMKEWKSFLAEDQEQQELFPGYDKEHREKRLSNWLAKSWGVQNGKPQTFYHATTKDFDTFNTSGTGFASVLGMSYEVERHGSFFAVDPKFAEDFIEDPNTGQVKEGGRVLPVYLSIQYPIDLRDNALSRMLSDDETREEFKANDIDLRSIYNHMYETDRWELFDGPEGAEFVENLKKLGFDGAIINEAIPNNSNARSGEVWVAFSPNQVKSIHNRGSFSPDDPRLMKENG